ncbi:type 2 periplasmic-binding domain-containing protein [Galactobacter caseinivorans]|uniref:hypothetical protein n=1 Tax=Galactobacter caseinivorans TaxID=2676123 RepID=UPI0038992828
MLCGPGQPESLLRNGSADVALLHRPYDTTAGFDTEDLHAEQQFWVQPLGHLLADRPHLSIADVNALTDLPLPRSPSGWKLPRRPRPEGSRPCPADPADRARTGLRTHESLPAQLRGDHAVVRVPDALVVTTVIAWPPQSRSPSVACLARTAAHL